MPKSTKSGQVPFAKKAAATKVVDKKTGGTPAAIRDRNRKYQIKATLADATDADTERDGIEACAHPTRGPPAVDLASVQKRLAQRVGLLGKREICLITGVSFPTV